MDFISKMIATSSFVLRSEHIRSATVRMGGMAMDREFTRRLRNKMGISVQCGLRTMQAF